MRASRFPTASLTRRGPPRPRAALLGALAAISALSGAPLPAAGEPEPAPVAPEPEPVPPQVKFFLTVEEGKPGDLAVLVLSIYTDVAIKSASVALNFEETKLRLEGHELVPQEVSPVDSVVKTDVDNRDEDFGDSRSEGFIYIELTASDSSGDLKWPVGRRIPVYKLSFRILRAAPEGFSPVKFTEVGRDPENADYRNKVEPKEPAASPAVNLPAENLEDGGVIILGIGEIGFFLRADTTMDRQYDISDPIRTLNFLFLASEPLPCFDSADANDDGFVDISDPVYTLQWLYASGRPPPDPMDWGSDPTQDKLCCEYTGGCS